MSMKLDAQLTLFENGKTFANPRRIALLKAIAQTGSISQGAKVAELSYKAAFDAVKDMNSRPEGPVIHSEKGGKGGGGAELTRLGQRVIQMYELLDKIQDMGLKALSDDNAPLDSLLGVMSRFSLQTSARNQLFGHISKVDRFDLHDVVTIELDSIHQVIATITHGSTIRLQLMEGKDAVALIKGPSIEVCLPSEIEAKGKDFDNQLLGTLISFSQDKEFTELELALSSDVTVCALVKNQQLPSTSLQIDMPLYALFASSQVTIATLC
ncbi:TOBE domain-containing protein [Photobacterium damselae]|uniref:TOBE domain-containing protein n=1 Tax=Photobacterium damselae TaxID=38293 RepID=UPI001EDCE532|nr:TOBE domain-containing protein [Photobacterium damselae]MCG3816167.1 TOBE domain-containing protein [Photobacterium damselae]